MNFERIHGDGSIILKQCGCGDDDCEGVLILKRNKKIFIYINIYISLKVRLKHRSHR